MDPFNLLKELLQDIFDAKYNFDTKKSKCLGHLKGKVVYWAHCVDFVTYQLPCSFGFPPPPHFKAMPIFRLWFIMKASLRRWHNAMTLVFISAKAGGHGLALTN